MRACFLLLVLALMMRCGTREDPGNPSPPKTPQDELATFQVDEGLEVQLVASEPMVEDPVVISFDEDGRLWVVEMRGFMPDIDGNGEEKPSGRISILEDTNGDGTMDKSTVYLDSLIMPRSLAVVKGGALIVEDYKLWLTQDVDGDLKADSKTLVDSTYGGTRLPEHSANGLWRGIDNWYYNARSRLRYRFERGEIIRDSTEFRGQWGMSHDDYGRLYYNYNWSQLHADLVPPNYLYANKHHTPTTGIDHGVSLDRRIYPIRDNPAVNRGYIPGTLDEKGSLLEFTAACSPYVLRTNAIGKDYYENVFVCEPSGNLVKRNVIRHVGDFNLKGTDPNPGREFFASRDERFRPVFITSGPDGALYVADMYRGLIQHGEYVTPYLREQTLNRKLDAPIHYGRIWRIVPKKWDNKQAKPMSAIKSIDLMDSLESKNGWTRDMAQRLLVERNDASITGELHALIDPTSVRGFNLGNYHALWVLEGMNALTPATLNTALHAEYFFHAPEAALRMLEPALKSNSDTRQKVGAELVSMLGEDLHPNYLQLALTARYLNSEHSFPIYKYVLQQLDTPLALIPDAVISGLSNKELDFTKYLLADAAWKTDDGQKGVFLEMLATAITQRRQPTELTQLFTMISKDPDAYSARAFLTAITIQGRGKWQPLTLSIKPAVVDQQGIINSMFEWPGHKIDPSVVKSTINLAEAQQKLFTEGRQQYLSVCAGCHGNNGEGIQRLAPPLAGSEWVLGDERRLALLVLHGIEGPIDVAGKRYDTPEILTVMPSHSTLDDGSITSILIYIRNEWGNNAGGVNRRTVGRLRHTTQGRVQPWSVEGLNEHVKNLKTDTDE